MLAWTQLDYLFVLGLLASLAALIGYLQRTAKRVHASTEARLASAMAERSALREFTEEGACSAPRPPCPFHQGSGQRPPTPPPRALTSRRFCSLLLPADHALPWQSWLPFTAMTAAPFTLRWMELCLM